MTPDQLRYVLRLEDAIRTANHEMRLSHGVSLPELLGPSRHAETIQAVIDGHQRRIEHIERGEVTVP